MTASSPDLALNLALAVIASSTAPLLLLDGDFTVVAASTSFCRAFQIDPADAPGRALFKLGTGEWDIPQLRSLLNATVSTDAKIDAYEMDLKRGHDEPCRLVLNAQRLDYGDPEHVRILLTVSDVTGARLAETLKDNLLREKAVLLQEIQHRVANSLQIIASVLMGSARKVQSEETRGYLHDAHSRVMSIAAVQQQLAASGLEDVKLHPYFTQLCQSLGASMISVRKRLSLDVTADESTVGPDVSVSLGLIVTELVINALKHAFPGHRNGKITVDYRAEGRDWTLSVTDDGVGFSPNPESTKPGLGTSLVEALAKQLHARVDVAHTHPGTTVSIIHTQLAALTSGAKIISIDRAV
jgi:two-component sensor histidine kinase